MIKFDQINTYLGYRKLIEYLNFLLDCSWTVKLFYLLFKNVHACHFNRIHVLFQRLKGDLIRIRCRVDKHNLKHKIKLMLPKKYFITTLQD